MSKFKIGDFVVSKKYEQSDFHVYGIIIDIIKIYGAADTLNVYGLFEAGSNSNKTFIDRTNFWPEAFFELVTF